MIIEITRNVGFERRGGTVELDVLDENGRLHTLRIGESALKEIIIHAMYNRFISKRDLDNALSAVARNQNIGERQ